MTLLAYCLAFRHLKPYVALPLVFGTALLTRNLVSKFALERIYFCLEPIYQEIRTHRSVTKQTPQGAKSATDLKIEPYVPIQEREDLSAADKLKAKRHFENRMKNSVRMEA